MVESDYDWSADPLAPGLNGTITYYNAITNTARVKSTDSSRGADNYAITYPEPARDVAARMLASVVDAVRDNFGGAWLSSGRSIGEAA